MKASQLPMPNRVQALETLLDSLSQRHPELRELAKALKITRSIQRTLFGPRYVKEWSLKRFTTSGGDPKKRNWPKHQRERAVKLNEKLFAPKEIG